MVRHASRGISRRDLVKIGGAGLLTAGTGAVLIGNRETNKAEGPATQPESAPAHKPRALNRVAADPTDVPTPINRVSPKTHQVELVAEEATARLESGIAHRFMTFNGQIPGPLIRVRRGDTVELSLTNAASSRRPHNVDFHAVYGTGGGSEATLAAPGQTKHLRFQCRYPGAFIYHCAVPNMDEHISRGMFGMIVVEPEGGLPPVDREFYLGQHELYTDGTENGSGNARFSYERMRGEDPAYVLFNGAVEPFTERRFGRIQARQNEVIRVFFVCGGPNLTSHFHPIGNVWSRMWPEGALANEPLRYVQTQPVAPGSCSVGDMELPVPETIKLVDHALSRVMRKGLLSEIEVAGEQRPGIFDGGEGTSPT